jgi:hypothetical protein
MQLIDGELPSACRPPAQPGPSNDRVDTHPDATSENTPDTAAH